jgi:hypothetical protein
MSKQIKKRSLSPDSQAPDSLDILDVKTKKVVRPRRPRVEEAVSVDSGGPSTPETVKRASIGTPSVESPSSRPNLDSSFEDSQTTSSQEDELVAAQKAFEAAKMALHRAEERVGRREGDNASEATSTGGSRELIFVQDSIPAPGLIVENSLLEWKALRSYEERIRAQGRSINRRVFLSEAAFNGHLFRMKAAVSHGLDLPPGISAEHDGCLGGTVDDFYRLINTLHGSGDILRVASPAQALAASFDKYELRLEETNVLQRVVTHITALAPHLLVDPRYMEDPVPLATISDEPPTEVLRSKEIHDEQQLVLRSMKEEQQMVLKAMNNSIRRAPSGHGPWIHDNIVTQLLDNVHDWLVEFGAQTFAGFNNILCSRSLWKTVRRLT